MREIRAGTWRERGDETQGGGAETQTWDRDVERWDTDVDRDRDNGLRKYLWRTHPDLVLL